MNRYKISVSSQAHADPSGWAITATRIVEAKNPLEVVKSMNLPPLDPNVVERVVISRHYERGAVETRYLNGELVRA